MRPVETLIVLASEHQARLYSNRGAGSGLTLVSEIGFDDFPGGDLAYADRPGRWTPGPGIAPHAFDHRESEREQERDRFAARLSDAIAAAAAGADRIVLAAAPRMLGALRAAMPAPLRARVAAERDRNLLKVPAADLPAHLDGAIVV